MTTEKNFTTVEEYKALDIEFSKLFRERLILGYTYGSCDHILAWTNQCVSMFYVYGITPEAYPKLEQELINTLKNHVKVEIRNKNEQFLNVLVSLTYREVFNGPLVQEWVQEARLAGNIIHKHRGWLHRGNYASKDESCPWVLPYYYTYQLQLREYGFPDWN